MELCTFHVIAVFSTMQLYFKPLQHWWQWFTVVLLLLWFQFRMPMSSRLQTSAWLSCWIMSTMCLKQLEARYV